LDDVVVVGYGTQSRRTLTTSIAKVDGNSLFDAPVATVGDALKGKVTGVRIASSNTLPGEAPRFLIRGGSSINMSNDPLVIVDGIQRSMTDINPNDIESMEVLKDAASAGIYGSRASNGIILVTTKKGSASKGPEITFDAQVGMSQPSRSWDLLNAREFLTLVRQALPLGPNSATILNGANAAGTGNVLSTSMFTTRYLQDGEEIPAGYQSMPDPLNPEKTLIFTDYDTEKDWFRNALWHKEYIGINGGSDAIKYAASASYMGDDGIVAMSKYRLFTMHGNTSFNITKRLSASTTFDFSRAIKNPLTGNYFNAIGRGLMEAPTHRNFDDEGHWITGGTNVNQQIASFYEAFYDREMATNNVSANLNLNWKITDALTATLQYAVFDSNYRGSYYAYGEVNGTRNYISATRSTTETRTETLRDHVTAYLNFNKKFGVHSINATGGFEYTHWRYWYLNAVGTGSSSDKVPILDSATDYTASNEDTEQAMMSGFGRINYSILDRYILSATLRADGSSKFAAGNRWGWFPTGSVAWIINEEPFWKVDPAVVNLFKVRASYGLTGNNGIGLWDTYGAYSTANSYSGYSTTLPSTMLNSSLRWEKTAQLDLGFDFSMFKDRIRFVFDYYDKTTSDMLFSITLPDTGTFGSAKANVGSARFYGFEVELHTANIQTRDISWTTDITYSFAKNKVLSLPEEYAYEEVDVYGNKTGRTAYRIGGKTMSETGYRFGGIAVGEPLGRIYGYKIDHIIQTEAEAAAALYDSESHGYLPSDGQSIQGRKAVGDYEWKNRPGSAKRPDGSEQINGEDQFLLGNVVPHSTGGINNTFRYKRLSFNIYFDYALGHSIYNYMKTRFIQNTLGNSNSNVSHYVYDCWQYPGDTNAKYARFFPNDADFGNRNFSRASDFNVERADYLCLRDVSLFYDLPEKWLKGIGVKKLTVGVTGNTLYYFTGVTGTVSPESGISTDSNADQYEFVNNSNSNGSFAPPARKILFNVRLTF
ncbi:MAG: SusC/RagA family TonB-linked outer membrane protein, partial [Bacteroidales bacterium]|nr:SusC/RagA family TonB-linked outer membrane protein [Bacteroidales bacterium]